MIRCVFVGLHKSSICNAPLSSAHFTISQLGIQTWMGGSIAILRNVAQKYYKSIISDLLFVFQLSYDNQIHFLVADGGLFAS